MPQNPMEIPKNLVPADPEDLIRAEAQRQGVDPDLAAAVGRTESGYQPKAVSPRGASGIMQLMPDTAKRFGVKNIFDPVENVRGGVSYLKWLNDRYNGNTDLVLAGYNAGEGAVDEHGGVPPYKETQNYIRKVKQRLMQGVDVSKLVPADASDLPAAPTDTTPFPAIPAEGIDNPYKLRNKMERLKTQGNLEGAMGIAKRLAGEPGWEAGTEAGPHNFSGQYPYVLPPKGQREAEATQRMQIGSSEYNRLTQAFQTAQKKLAVQQQGLQDLNGMLMQKVQGVGPKGLPIMVDQERPEVREAITNQMQGIAQTNAEIADIIHQRNEMSRASVGMGPSGAPFPSQVPRQKREPFYNPITGVVTKRLGKLGANIEAGLQAGGSLPVKLGRALTVGGGDQQIAEWNATHGPDEQITNVMSGEDEAAAMRAQEENIARLGELGGKGVLPSLVRGGTAFATELPFYAATAGIGARLGVGAARMLSAGTEAGATTYEAALRALPIQNLASGMGETAAFGGLGAAEARAEGQPIGQRAVMSALPIPALKGLHGLKTPVRLGGGFLAGAVPAAMSGANADEVIAQGLLMSTLTGRGKETRRVPPIEMGPRLLPAVGETGAAREPLRTFEAQEGNRPTQFGRGTNPVYERERGGPAEWTVADHESLQDSIIKTAEPVPPKPGTPEYEAQAQAAFVRGITAPPMGVRPRVAETFGTTPEGVIDPRTLTVSRRPEDLGQVPTAQQPGFVTQTYPTAREVPPALASMFRGQNETFFPLRQPTTPITEPPEEAGGMKNVTTPRMPGGPGLRPGMPGGLLPPLGATGRGIEVRPTGRNYEVVVDGETVATYPQTEFGKAHAEADAARRRAGEEPPSAAPTAKAEPKGPIAPLRPQGGATAEPTPEAAPTTEATPEAAPKAEPKVEPKVEPKAPERDPESMSMDEINAELQSAKYKSDRWYDLRAELHSRKLSGEGGFLGRKPTKEEIKAKLVQDEENKPLRVFDLARLNDLENRQRSYQALSPDEQAEMADLRRRADVNQQTPRLAAFKPAAPKDAVQAFGQAIGAKILGTEGERGFIGEGPKGTLKLVHVNEAPSDYNDTTRHDFEIRNADDALVGHLSARLNSKTGEVYVGTVGANPEAIGLSDRAPIESYANKLGYSEVKGLLRQLKETLPEMTTINGARVTGARHKGGWKPGKSTFTPLSTRTVTANEQALANELGVKGTPGEEGFIKLGGNKGRITLEQSSEFDSAGIYPGKTYRFRMKDEAGRNVGSLGLTVRDDGKASVNYIGTERMAAGGPQHTIGYSDVKGILRQLQERFPHMTELTGQRITGMRNKYGGEIYVKPLNVKPLPKNATLGEAIDHAQKWEGQEGYIGTGARLDKEKSDALEAAKRMFRAGYSSEEIRQATGWFQGKFDSKLRYETADERAKLTPEWEKLEEARALSRPTDKQVTKLSAVLDHPELFAAYPDLKDVNVVRQRGFLDIFGSLQGSYDRKNNVINITPNADDPLSVLMHEVQHWIQNKEDFPYGGNESIAQKFMSPQQRMAFKQQVIEKAKSKLGTYDEAIATNRDFMDRLSRVADTKALDAAMDAKQVAKEAWTNAYAEGKTREDRMAILKVDQAAEEALLNAVGFKNKAEALQDKNWDWWWQLTNHGNSEELRKTVGNRIHDLLNERMAHRQLIQAAEEGQQRALDTLTKPHLHEVYKNIAGEVEARDVQARLKFSPELRKATLPYASEPDVTKESAIVLRSKDLEGVAGFLKEGSRGKYKLEDDIKRSASEHPPEDLSAPGYHGYNVYNENGNRAGRLEVTISKDKTNAHVNWAQLADEDLAPGLSIRQRLTGYQPETPLPRAEVFGLLRQLKDRFPTLQTIDGERITGTRNKYILQGETWRYASEPRVKTSVDISTPAKGQNEIIWRQRARQEEFEARRSERARLQQEARFISQPSQPRFESQASEHNDQLDATHLPYESFDQVAQRMYGTNYDSLSPEQRNGVIDSWTAATNERGRDAVNNLRDRMGDAGLSDATIDQALGSVGAPEYEHTLEGVSRSMFNQGWDDLGSTSRNAVYDRWSELADQADADAARTEAAARQAEQGYEHPADSPLGRRERGYTGEQGSISVGDIFYGMKHGAEQAKTFLKRVFDSQDAESNYSAFGAISSRLIRTGTQLEQARPGLATRAMLRYAGSPGQASFIIRAVMPKIAQVLKGSGISHGQFVNAILESRLRGIEDRWRRFSEAALHGEESDLLSGYSARIAPLLDAMEGQRSFNNLHDQAAAYLSSGDIAGLRNFLHQTFADAANVVSGNHMDLGGHTLEALQANPQFNRALDIFKNNIGRPLAEAHASNEGVFSDALGPLNAYLPLIPEAGRSFFGASKYMPYLKPRNPSNRFATGLAEAYDATLGALRQQLTFALKTNNRAAFIDALVREGVIKRLGATEPSQDTIQVDGRDFTARTERVGNGEFAPRVVVPQWLHNEVGHMLFKDYFNSPPGLVRRTMDLMNGIALVGPLDATFHTYNIMGAMVANTPFLADSIIGKTIGNTPVTKMATAIIKIANMDPFAEENLPLFQRAAKLGLIPDKYAGETYDKQMAEMTGAKYKANIKLGPVRVPLTSISPMLYGPKGLDIRARLVMLQIADAMNPDATPMETAKFVNQLGNYTRDLQGSVERAIKSTPVAPFYTAGSTMLRGGVNAALGTGPFPTTGMSKSTEAGYRAAQLASGGSIGTIALWMLAYKAYRGMWPQDDPKARFLQIPLNDGDRRSQWGKIIYGEDFEKDAYFSPLNWMNPLVGRGFRALGVSGYIDARQAGATKGQGIEEGFATGTLNALMHPITSGPLVRGGFVTATGQEPAIIGARDPQSGKLAPQWLSATTKMQPGWGAWGSRIGEGLLNVNSFFQNIATAAGFGHKADIEKEQSGGLPGRAIKAAVAVVAPRLVGNASAVTDRAAKFQKQLRASGNMDVQQAKQDMIDNIRRGKFNTAMQGAMDNLQSGFFTENDFNDVMTRGFETHLEEAAKQLDLTGGLVVYSKATPDQKEKLLPIIYQKLDEAVDAHPQKFGEIMRQFQAVIK